VSEFKKHCCECSEQRNQSEILLALIQAANDSTVCSDQIPADEREESQALGKAAREFLIAYWARKKPALEMPPGFGKALDAT